jgi:hypothetical protein
MSSYQFVNSLAACYNPTGGRGDPSATDYYGGGGGGQGGQGQPYPNCYSPQIATAPSGGNGGNAVGNYYGGSPTPNHVVTNLSSEFRGQGVVSPAVGVASLGSCKYAGTPTTNNNNPGTQNQNSVLLEGPELGSPQDLTTGSGASSAGSSVCSTPRSPPLVQGSKGGNQSNNSSSNNSNSSPNTGTTKGNPPHIYPWMKRVHLGQSKICYLYLLYYKCLSLPLRTILSPSKIDL